MAKVKSVGLSPSFLFRKRARALIPKRWHQRLERLEQVPRVYIIPTMMGWYFAAISLVLFLIAVFYGHNLAYYATFLFFSFVSLSAIVANNNIAQIHLRWKQNKGRGRVDGQALSPLVLHNSSSRPRYDIRLEIAGQEVALVNEVPAYSTVEIEVDLSRLIHARGVYAISRMVISTRFPFSLFYAWAWHRCELELLVHPAASQGSLTHHASAQEKEGKGSISKQVGNEEFFIIRSHRPGEGLSRIDRRASMRIGTPQIREFRQEKARSVVLDLRYGEVEEVLSQAVAWLDQLPEDYECGLIFPNGLSSDICRGHHQRILLYDEIALYEKTLQELV